jgi:serine/threonine-protein kinase
VVRSLNALEGSAVLVGVNTAYAPFFSPDGQWIGFNDQGDDTIKRVAVTGGAPLTVAAVGSGRMTGAVWTEDDRIVFGTAESSGLWQVDAGGGAPEPLTRLDAARGETNHEWPDILPSGAAVLFTARRGGVPASAEIVAFDLATRERHVLVTGGSYARYVPPGYLVYGFPGELRAVRFDADRLAVAGTPVPVVERLMTKAPSGAAEFGVASDGTLLYVRADPAATAEDTLVWVDGSGMEGPIETFGGSVQMPRMSPDGTRMVLVRTVDEGDEDLWLYSPSRGIAERITDDGGLERDPAWSPEGSRLAYYASALDGGEGLVWRAADGTGPVHRLSTGNHRPISWLADDTIVYADLGTTVRGIGIVPVSDPDEGRLLVEMNMGTFSVLPSGSWIAYSDTVTGSYEVYVRPFPDISGPATRISTGGGLDPIWSPDGTALYYRQDDSIMRVAVAAGPPSSWPAPTRVFSGAYKFSIPGPTQFDIDRDGKRFLMIRGAVSTTSEPEPILVRNWVEELKELLPRD